jgi:acetyl-CoA carboxylase biotin carboxyl carrier protein
VTEQEQTERELSDDAPAEAQEDLPADGRANDELQARILAAVDRLAPVLTGGPLQELEVESGDLVVRLAKPLAVPALAGSPASSATAPTAGIPSSPYGEPEAGMRFVTAPLTGVWYTAPSPGARPYVSAGGEVAMGQVVGLIEAMKLFNEIKSDVAGTVTRILAETGTLVKRQQPLLEVDPS